MRLQVMICTYKAEGLLRVAKMHLPKIADVGYIVSCQSAPAPIPESLKRDDIQVSFTPSTGLSNNRNHALDLVAAPYCLIADDDLIFYPEGIAQIAECFDRNPDLDIATFMCEYPYPTVYPPVETDLRRRYKGYNISSCEIAFRTAALRKHGLRFSTLLGIGAPYLHAGEENMFLLSALKGGLTGRFFPITIARHPEETTGTRSCKAPGVIRAKGAYVAFAYPWTACLRLPLLAWRAPGCTLTNLYHLTSGALYAIRHRRRIL